MNAGIGSWTYPWAVGVPGYPRPANPLDAFGLLDRAVLLGVGVVQIADNLPVDAMPPAELDRLRDSAERAGIALELGTRGVEPPHLARYLELACCLGARLVRTLAGTAAFTPDIGQAETWLRDVLPCYERAGVILALENYEKHTTAELAGMVGRIGSPCLGICLDTTNSLGTLETPADVVHRLAPLAVNVHVKDFGIARIPSMMGYLIEGRPAGAGMLDIPMLLGELRRCGRDPNIIVEHWPPFCGDADATIAMEAGWAEQSVRYLQAQMRG